MDVTSSGYPSCIRDIALYRPASLPPSSNASTRAPKLVPEILLAVFKLLPRGALQALRISHVCRDWRDIAHWTPSLWTHIVVELGPWSRVGAKWRLRSGHRPFEHAPKYAPWLSRDVVSEVIQCLPERYLDACGTILDLNLVKKAVQLSKDRPISLTLLLNKFVRQRLQDAVTSTLLECKVRIVELNLFYDSWTHAQPLIHCLFPLKNLEHVSTRGPEDLQADFWKKHRRSSSLWDLDEAPCPQISRLAALSSTQHCPGVQSLDISGMFSWFFEDPFLPSFCWSGVCRLTTGITDDDSIATVASMFPGLTHLTLTINSWYIFEGENDPNGRSVMANFAAYPERLPRLQCLIIHNAWTCHAYGLLPFFDQHQSRYRRYTVNYVGTDHGKLSAALLAPIRSRPASLVIEGGFQYATVTATTAEGYVRELRMRSSYFPAIKAHLSTVLDLTGLVRLSFSANTMCLLATYFKDALLPIVEHFTLVIYTTIHFYILLGYIGRFGCILPTLRVWRISLIEIVRGTRQTREFTAMDMTQIVYQLGTSNSVTKLELENLTMPPDWTKPSDCDVQVVML
ncbi:hypothetical protein BKA62DRAFT_429570 [Auriculariales sp. MPI-PUGE-AT-0066]|nr:hypothetical protein BKA62DRAFT_429570 [Auriculariales sp. MPI-PUGE-AT-0066]